MCHDVGIIEFRSWRNALVYRDRQSKSIDGRTGRARWVRVELLIKNYYVAANIHHVNYTSCEFYYCNFNLFK